MAEPLYGVIEPPSCTRGQVSVGTKCHLRCAKGYVPQGNIVAVCNLTGNWMENNALYCIPPQINRFPTHFNPVSSLPEKHNLPYINCPKNARLPLDEKEVYAFVELQKPMTNLQQIHVHPKWAESYKFQLKVGKYVFKFSGLDPRTGNTISCKTHIVVQHSNGTSCTSSFSVTLGDNQNERSVNWTEPRFAIKTKNLTRSHFPGQIFPQGVHRVSYKATDEHGSVARCDFEITVKAPVPKSKIPFSHVPLDMSNVIPDIRQPVAASKTGFSQATALPNHYSFIECPGKERVRMHKPVSYSYFRPEWLIRIHYKWLHYAK